MSQSKTTGILLAGESLYYSVGNSTKINWCKGETFLQSFWLLLAQRSPLNGALISIKDLFQVGRLINQAGSFYQQTAALQVRRRLLVKKGRVSVVTPYAEVGVILDGGIIRYGPENPRGPGGIINKFGVRITEDQPVGSVLSLSLGRSRCRIGYG